MASNDTVKYTIADIALNAAVKALKCDDTKLITQVRNVGARTGLTRMVIVESMAGGPRYFEIKVKEVR